MDLIQTIVLALVQGITEFLPVSSSGHLVLTPALFGWTDQGLAYDIAVHFGTLAAVIVYFRRDLADIVAAMLSGFSAEAKLGWQILLATVPLGIAGIVFADVVETSLRSPAVIAVSSVVFGLLLWWADRAGRRERSEKRLSWRDVMLIGASQALALIPGASRSGVTMTAALALGLSRGAAGRFSFLLSIPAIGMVAAWQIVQLTQEPQAVDWLGLGLAAGLSALTAFASIAVFLNLIGRLGMGVFAVYRIALALVIFAVLV